MPIPTLLVRLVLIASAALVSGCAQTLYVKDGATSEQFQADQFDCEQKVVTMYGGYANMGPGHAVMARGDMKRCLAVKGYREMSYTEYEAAHTAERDRIRAENAARAAEARKHASESPTPEDVWRAKSGAASGNEYPRPAPCVGEGCAPSMGR